MVYPDDDFLLMPGAVILCDFLLYPIATVHYFMLLINYVLLFDHDL